MAEASGVGRVVLRDCLAGGMVDKNVLYVPLSRGVVQQFVRLVLGHAGTLSYSAARTPDGPEREPEQPSM